jgi:hypothetical protein
MLRINMKTSELVVSSRFGALEKNRTKKNDPQTGVWQKSGFSA